MTKAPMQSWSDEFEIGYETYLQLKAEAKKHGLTINEMLHATTHFAFCQGEHFQDYVKAFVDSRQEA